MLWTLLLISQCVYSYKVKYCCSSCVLCRFRGFIFNSSAPVGFKERYITYLRKIITCMYWNYWTIQYNIEWPFGASIPFGGKGGSNDKATISLSQSLLNVVNSSILVNVQLGHRLSSLNNCRLDKSPAITQKTVGESIERAFTLFLRWNCPSHIYADQKASANHI